MLGRDTGISVVNYFAIAAAAFVAIAVVLWFAIPGPDAKHSFVSPSGQVTLELGEACREQGCARVIVMDEKTADGGHRRRGCEVPLVEQHPVLLNAHPLWAADERSVDIVYADAEGVGGKFALDLSRDCTRTQ